MTCPLCHDPSHRLSKCPRWIRPVPKGQVPAYWIPVLASLVPYAESRAEDLSEAAERGEEDPDYPGAKRAWEAVHAAKRLLASQGLLA